MTLERALSFGLGFYACSVAGIIRVYVVALKKTFVPGIQLYHSQESHQPGK